MTKSTKIIIDIKTFITTIEVERLIKAMRAVAEVHICSEYVEVTAKNEDKTEEETMKVCPKCKAYAVAEFQRYCGRCETELVERGESEE